MRIAILLFSGFDELDAIGPFEVLRLAERLGAPVNVRLAVTGPITHVSGANGLRIEASQLHALSALSPGLVIVPGGGWNAKAATGAWAEYHRGAIPAALLHLHGTGVLMASVCTGAMLLAAAGMLQGRSATTHRLAIDDLRRHGVNIIGARVVDDGDIITAGGVTSGLDLALWLVERFGSPDLASQVASRLEYSRQGPVWRQGTLV